MAGVEIITPRATEIKEEGEEAREEEVMYT
jgi:hypothetical protein